MQKREIFKTIQSYSDKAYRWITEEFENDISYDFTPRCEKKFFNQNNDYAQKLVKYLKEKERDLKTYLEITIPEVSECCMWADEEENFSEALD